MPSHVPRRCKMKKTLKEPLAIRWCSLMAVPMYHRPRALAIAIGFHAAGRPGGGLAGSLRLGTRGHPFWRRLERSRPEEEIHDVPFVRLQPVQLNRRDGADVETVDVRGVDE